ncbi:hypothetical protein K503DRAFT_700285 [Rhizopogon vinicolor AM-OR11-026]|uniref:Protection of telomeres protein 1 n=1 Tax=Rhizopogon vinicolor AM-OR11-026 TaxID=1314800 RepID=A0A1B7MLQ9_9AGAM|nr:hypothetical protein K503DRAFT_700285 [Rhizopogon vinicolor AM-OR11-026]
MHDASVEHAKTATTNPDPPTVAQILQSETVGSEKSLEVPAAVLASHEYRNSSPAANLPRSDAQPRTKELSKAQRRKRRKKERDAGELAVQAASEARPKPGGRELAAPQAEIIPSRVPSLPPAVVPPPPNLPSNKPASSSSERINSSSSEKTTSIAVTTSSPSPVNNSTSNHRQGALAMKAGLVTQGGDKFSALRNIAPGFINVIGVVVSTRALRQTRTNEWTRGFSLVDPSCMEDDVDVVNHEFIVNCFQKKHTEWLPHAEVGDIVLFRRVKATTFNGGFNGVGYEDKLRWVTYDRNTRRFRDPDMKDAPHSETSDGGYGYSFSPFYKPDMHGKEAEYCAQLADWWQGMQAKNQGVASVHCVARGTREHHLISEVTPDTFPQGYFDCTVEILHGFENTEGPYTIYVTDYTANPHIYPVQANWCPPELSTYAFRMEMWDKAKILAQTMQPGEFWYLANSRLMGKDYFEGKLVETYKSRKLDETQSNQNPHLRALLERKKKYEQGGGTASSSAQFDDKLIEDVDEDVRFFSCTVEVLHIDLASAEEPLAYVTDYTFHPALVNPAEQAPWTLGLDRRIVKIVLEGGQKSRARDLQPGATYRIKNLRLIKRTGVSGAFGRLGGDERLIVEAKDHEKDEVKALLQRKEKWKMEMKRDGLSIESAGNTPTSHPPAPETSQNLTLKQIMASTTCPNKFTFIAQVTDFYPLLLDNAMFLFCTKLQPGRKCCIECDDMLDTHCRWRYGLFFRLEDDEGSHIIVHVSEKCQLLAGLPPTDLQMDSHAFDKFVARLKPVIGNLEEVHDGYLKKEDLRVVTPKMQFTIESWNTPDQRCYGLRECTPL